ncbi:F1 complex, OSCP/delta subunit of ATPase [Dendrothele bispora CBS 962.96]|uniref:ATP synthase subunit 5, mitochondrial n=1 Tax=Dendrothele bispora (strain CBS 962.96) TaxID=1314807 RepID=A0A4S8MUA9_DENBC|nr:F1 complex, OSCP/delta subunit of ATPase [Dendrothele bispora CBS 962.96]THV06820.1 F1 complex, OSCP/delta subunit of ATPase [Dendrothele bispora CBS 962.96]
MLLTSASRSVAAVPGLGRRAASAVALKYSNALYSAALAKSPQTLTKVHSELATFADTIKQNPDINAFVHNPTLSAKDRTTGLGSLFSTIEGSGSKKEALSDVTKNLLTVLSENGRLGEAEGVIEGFNELVAQYRGELNVTVTSAAPLPKDVLTRLESTLKQSQAAQEAKSLKITNKVNPSLLGGFLVDFGDKTIDLSVSSRVTKLNNALQQAV